MRITVLHGEDAAEDPVLGQITAALTGGGHDIGTLAAERDVPRLAGALEARAPELVFNLAESFAGVSALEASVAGLLNLLGLRYTGSSPAGLALAGDKSLCKKVLAFHGIRTPEFATLYRGALDWADELDFPLIVKPPQEDASMGITAASVVRDVSELLRTLGDVHSEFRQPVMVERYIEGREFYVGVLGNGHAEALPVVEMDFTGYPEGQPRLASWNAKWGEDGAGSGAEYAGTKSVLAEGLPAELEERLKAVALDAFQALRLRDYARIDLRVDEGGEIFVIEANPNCYLEKGAEFARAAAASGLEYDDLIARITELAAARYAR